MASLADDAASLVKEAQEYLEVGPIHWSDAQHQHMLILSPGGLEIPVSEAGKWFAERREEIIEKIIKHLFVEVSQAGYSGGHGSSNAYKRGCRGLLCRRANREDLRAFQGQKASRRFAVPDELLDEAESRILPEEVVGHIRYSDRVATA